MQPKPDNIHADRLKELLKLAEPPKRGGLLGFVDFVQSPAASILAYTALLAFAVPLTFQMVAPAMRAEGFWQHVSAFFGTLSVEVMVFFFGVNGYRVYAFCFCVLATGVTASFVGGQENLTNWERLGMCSFVFGVPLAQFFIVHVLYKQLKQEKERQINIGTNYLKEEAKGLYSPSQNPIDVDNMPYGDEVEPMPAMQPRTPLFTCEYCGQSANAHGIPFLNPQQLSAHLGKCKVKIEFETALKTKMNGHTTIESPNLSTAN